MSLDVYLKRDIKPLIEEWEKRKLESLAEAKDLKGLIPIIEDYYERNKPADDGDDYYWANITHNLGKMADEAGIYKHLWRPEEINIKIAKELIEPLTNGLKELKDKPEHFKQFNSSNGWGMYEHFVPFVEKYLNACIEYPDAIVYVSR